MVEIHDISPSTEKETLLVNYIVTGTNGTDHNIAIPSKGRVLDDDDEIYNVYKEYAKKTRDVPKWLLSKMQLVKEG
ncbi:hypothetical protein MKW92_048489, partial [Papaver armeniacum]